MMKRYAEVKIRKEDEGWNLLECSEELLQMTGFILLEIKERFNNNFLKMFSAADIQAACELFLTDSKDQELCRWIFTLTCAEKEKTLPVLLQSCAGTGEPDIVRVMIHEALFLGEHTEKMERRLLSLQESIPSGLCQTLLDEKFTIIWNNEYFLEMIGYTEEQFAQELHSKAAGYIHPEDRAALDRVLKEAIKNRQRVSTTEMRIVRRDGNIRNILTSLSFTGESINGFPVLYSMGIDITAQKREQELIWEHERMRFAMEQSSGYILEYEIETRKLQTCDFLKKYFGMQGSIENVPDTLICTGLMEDESAEALRDLFGRIEEGNEKGECIICLRERTELASEVWIRISFNTIFDQEKYPMKALLMAADITAHHMIEMRYKEEEKRRAAMTYDMNFSCQLDLTTNQIIFANEPKFKFFDFKKSTNSREFMRKNAGEYVHPDDREEYLRKMSKEYLTRQFEDGIPEMSLEFRAKEIDGAYNAEGTYQWRKGVGHIIREPEHGHVCAYIYTRNIEEEKQQELELHRHAELDALTGLYNRYTIEVYCNKIMNTQPADIMAAFYVLDLDNFKVLNDTYGYFHGDEMLKQAADSLRNIFGKEVLIGRLGGDELVVFQPCCPSVEHAGKMITEVCKTLKVLDDAAGVVTVSAGLSFAPKDGRTFADLYYCADDALRSVKHAGKDGWTVYTKSEHLPAADKIKSDTFSISREWLLEESAEIIYVCDFYNYNLLYMNPEAKRIGKIEDDSYIGRKCYEVLQNQSRPCSFCTNHLLCAERFYCWEFHNTFLNTTMWLRDRIIDWYGTPARIEFATDVTVMGRRNQELLAQVEIDNAIISCLRILNGSTALEDAIIPMLQCLAEFYNADRAFIFRYEPQNCRLYSYYEWDKEGIRHISQILDKEGFTPSVEIMNCFEKHKNYFLDGPAVNDGTNSKYCDVLYDAGVTCQRCVPFYINDKPAGLIGLDNPTTLRNEITVLETLGYFVSEEMTRNKLAEKLTFLGYHDLLTGLWNRNRYVEYLNEIEEGNLISLGVAVADINALKSINKLRGHAYGDKVVREAAEFLQTSFNEANIFRLSGDEFVIHCENLERNEFISLVMSVRTKTFDHGDYSISLGYAWSNCDINCSKLTVEATDVMILQKTEYYRQEKERKLTNDKHNYARLIELQEHMAKGYFKMYLQPKADCSSFQLNGAEALIRYQSPEAGVIPPDRFIPILEHDYTIQYIDFFIFEEVCKLLSKWKQEERPLVTISLNFSRQTALDPDLINKMKSITDQYDINKENIEVEITETLGDYENSTIAEISEKIKQEGFRLALDDFGSSYTNMAMLSTVPVNVLKLDRSLIRDVMNSRSNQMVLKAILNLCKELGISSIAEGVETQEQLELLRSLHCDDIQGYLFGKPITVDEFETSYQ